MRTIAVCLCCLALAACSSSTPSEPTPTEIKVSDKELRDAPEEVLLIEGKRLYRAGLYSVAQESFDSLRLNYPNSPYAEFAEIKVADSHFETRDFQAAAGLFEDFLKNHPASQAVPYALLRAGRSYQLVNQGVGRDTAPLEKALELYERVIREYPNTVYAQEARSFRESTRQVLADYERFVMDFYKKQANEKALLARQKAFDARWKDIPLQDKVVVADAAKSSDSMRASIRPLSNPNIVAVRKAFELSQAPKTQALAQTKQATSVLDDGAARGQSLTLQRVSCDKEAIFVFFDQAIADSAFVAKNKQLTPQAGKVSLQLPLPVRKTANIDCFGEKDLSISAQGTLTLNTTEAFTLMTLENPPRLMLRKRGA